MWRVLLVGVAAVNAAEAPGAQHTDTEVLKAEDYADTAALKAEHYADAAVLKAEHYAENAALKADAEKTELKKEEKQEAKEAPAATVLVEQVAPEAAEHTTSAEDVETSSLDVELESPVDPNPSPTRWLWWLVIAYMFYAQATICDEYFVQSIKVVVETFKIPEDVAGATLMALGCNGPELFTNFIAIFITHNDVGVGTIVGSEIFNLLCIVGGSIIACPVLPLLVEKPAFIRDCSFYALSIGLLAWTLADGKVVFYEALTLLICCALYALCVAGTKPFMDKMYPEPAVAVSAGGVPGGRKSLNRSSTAGLDKEALRDMLQKDEAEIKIIMPNRLEHTIDVREAVGVNVLPEGLEIVGDAVMNPQSFQAPLLSKTEDKKIIRYEDIVLVEESRERNVPIALHCDDDHLDFMQVQLWFKDAGFQDKIMSAVKKNLGSKAVVKFQGDIAPGEVVMAELAHADSIQTKILHIVCLPLELCLEYTMSWCDVKVPVNEHKWAQCFCMSMVWLAVFSYLMCSVADTIHQEFGISTALLGITLCAVGTSFPNFYASLIMAGENRSAMAIANALGSNIQNVFLALAVPWTVKTYIDGEYDVSANGIGTGVAWMGFTLVVVVAFAVRYSFKFEKWMGWVLVALYGVYLIQTICF